MKEETILNDKRHLYLYAKGHYKTTDTINDLKKIIAKITMIHPEHISIKDIKYWLLSEAYKYINTHHSFIDFLDSNCFTMHVYTNENKNISNNFAREFNLYLIYKSLSILRLSKIKDIDIELGVIDEEILPKA